MKLSAISDVLPFHKLHAQGNDFILIDEFTWEKTFIDNEERVRKICTRRSGIGADGILLLQPQNGNSFRMNVLNADGTTAETSGNGLRCAGLYCSLSVDQGIDQFCIETGNVEHLVSVSSPGRFQSDVEVEFPYPDGISEAPLNPEMFPESLQSKLDKSVSHPFFTVGLENPHCVVFVQSRKGLELSNVGPLIENHPQFPQGTNVEFVELCSTDSLKVRVWERGVEETPSCGSGAIAAAVASFTVKDVKSLLSVKMTGGTMEVRKSSSGGSVFLKGPAQYCYQGEFPLVEIRHSEER